MKKKEVDCVQMQHRGAKGIQERLAGRTRLERIEYWRKRTEALCNRQEMLRKRRGALDRAG